MSTSPQDFNAKIIEEFRSNEGRVGGMFEGMSLLLLHHRGAKSGAERLNPLVYSRDGDRYVVYASKAGAPSHPAWYGNVMANPRTTIEVGTDELAVEAFEATGDERDRLFREQKQRAPQFAEYEQKAGERIIPVVLLKPLA
ncbi:MAG: nitroreductase family deazaflavin-dependent oxidoreductase [Solirubrobacteraceae bacterium]